MHETATEITINRIKQMEFYFEIISGEIKYGNYSAMRKKPFDKMLEKLVDYSESGRWLKDFEADERGELPQELKRGVLSEDGLYNLLCDIKEHKN